MARYAKFFVAVGGAAVIAIQAAVADDVIGPGEVFAVAIAVATAIGVYLYPNKPPV